MKSAVRELGPECGRQGKDYEYLQNVITPHACDYATLITPTALQNLATSSVAAKLNSKFLSYKNAYFVQDMVQYKFESSIDAESKRYVVAIRST